MDSKTRLNVVGLVKDPNFHVARSISEGLKMKFPEAFLDPGIQPLLELDWHEYLSNKRRELRGEAWCHAGGLMCLLDGVLLGDDGDLARWAAKEWGFSLAAGPGPSYAALAEDEYAEHLRASGHPFVFIDVEMAGEAAGRLTFELFSDLCPKASENFRALCSGERRSTRTGLPLSYRGSVFHRVVPDGWVQGGDVTPERRGDGGESIYGPTFEDESFAVPHGKRGVLGMANQGPHSNGSQFYITLQPTPWMDRTYVAFGQLVEGVDVLRRLEEAPTCHERPTRDCKVTDCGVLTY